MPAATANAPTSLMKSLDYETLVRVVTLWNNGPRHPGHGQTTCSIFASVRVRPGASLQVSPQSKNPGGPTYVQLPFPQEPARSPPLGPPVMVLDRNLSGARPRPKGPQKGS